MSTVKTPVIATRRGIAATAVMVLGALAILAVTQTTVFERAVALVPAVGLLIFSIALNVYRARHGAERASLAWLGDAGEAAGPWGEGAAVESVHADPGSRDADADEVLRD